LRTHTATRDGTATAGELEKTVSVPLLDDALDEGEETFTLRLTNARGAARARGRSRTAIRCRRCGSRASGARRQTV